MSNRLAKEKSPYLLQHAQNPVDWYPWGPDAFEKAVKEDKPILLSIGYSTCHWCHVMEHESFENEAVARVMNDYVVSIKVDREERPDVDKIYMTAVSAMTGQGGWPLNVFLTPDLKPFFGGTYFPPEPRYNHPSWTDLVQHIGKSWKVPEERDKMLKAASHITESLRAYTSAAGESAALDEKWIEGGFLSLKSTFDHSRGGFSEAPKFPMPVYQSFLFTYWARTHNKEALDMALLTLREMSRGGIYDHLGGGFARYSTDGHWHVPHFEKMLYDNAQLTRNYLDAYQITREEDWKRVARETLDYVLRDMTSPEGGFYSAEDADSFSEAGAKEKKEGAFYVWSKKEIMDLLEQEAGDLFCFRYGVREGGNALQDPHGEFTGKNIPYAAHPLAETALHFTRREDEVAAILERSKAALFAVREKRPRPHRDDKVISAWNGLMISAFARAYQVLREPRDLQAAQKAAGFLADHLYDAGMKTLFRRWRDGQKQENGIADDYAFVIQGLLDLYEADFDVRWLRWAEDLTLVLIDRFYDKTRDVFFMTAVDQDPHLLFRMKEDQDNVEPAAASVTVMNLLRLSELSNKKEHRQLAIKVLESVGPTLRDAPRALPVMLQAMSFLLGKTAQVIIEGDVQSNEAKELLQVLHRFYVPNKIVMTRKPEENGKAKVYLCENYSCKNPTSDPGEFEKQLRVIPGSSSS